MFPNLSLWLRLLLAAATALSVSWLATPPVKRFAESIGAMDVPKDERRVHNHPIPRMGGLAIFLGFVLSMLLFVDMSTQIMGLLLGTVLAILRLPQIQQMLPKLDSILASVNALLADPTLSRSLHNVEDITAGLTKTTAELNTLTASLNRQLPGIMGKADGVMANADTLTHTLNTLDLAGTMAKVNQTLQNVERMTAQLNSNEGTLGLLMRDPQLYNNLNATMMHADSLMIDLKSHPKRYVHFSVFGKKDK